MVVEMEHDGVLLAAFALMLLTFTITLVTLVFNLNYVDVEPMLPKGPRI